jgi:hypothetical protein
MSSSGSNLLLPPWHVAARRDAAVAAAAANGTPSSPPDAGDFDIPGAVFPIDGDGNRVGAALWVERSQALDIPDYVWQRIPEPTGWRLLVQEYAPPEVSRGGVIIADVSRDWHNAGNFIGRVLAMGPTCYRHPKFQIIDHAGDRVQQEEWCMPGEWVTFSQYTGTPRKIMHDGVEWRFRTVFDENIEGIVPTPAGLTVYVR